MFETSDGGQDDFAHGDDPEGQSPVLELLQPEDIEKKGYFACEGGGCIVVGNAY